MAVPDFDLLTMKPTDTPDYMVPAWLGCLSFAIANPDIVAQFKADTGFAWNPPTNAIDVMIDEATGHGQDFIIAFVQWVNNTNVWGPIAGPPC